MIRKAAPPFPTSGVNDFLKRISFNFDGVLPPRWRCSEIRSDVSLPTLHHVIEAIFDWWDAHLYRFSLGHPYSWQSELFLCDFDMKNSKPWPMQGSIAWCPMSPHCSSRSAQCG